MGEEEETIAKRTLDEHKKLFGFMSEVLRHLEPRAAEGAPTRWAEELHSYLSELHDNLTAHFAFEESSQFWDDLAHAFPGAAARISRLVAEHDRILESVEKLARRAREAASGKKGETSSLAAGVQGAIASLKRHEAEEDELIQTLYWDDLGSGD